MTDPMMHDPAPPLTATATAQYLGLSRRNFYYMLKNGRFNVQPVPNRTPPRWSVADLDAWKAGTYALAANSGER